MKLFTKYTGLLAILFNAVLFITPIEASPSNALNTLSSINHIKKSSSKAPLVPTAPTVNAASYILIDFHSGRLLAHKNSDEKMEPASLSKLMTMYVVEQEILQNKLSLSDKVLISTNAWKTSGSKMFVNVDDHISVEDLIRGVVIQSGNDASVALAEHIAGSEEAFAQLMNHYAKNLGMKNTHFTNATGLPDPDLYSTAKDMSLLAQALIRNSDPKIFPLYAEKWFTYQNIRQQNRNRLLWRDIGVDGLKTGHTESAGYCLVSTALRNGMRLISVVMGSPSDAVRAEESQKLLSYGFRFFETHKLFAAYTPLEKARVWMGSQKEVPLGLTRDIYVTIPQGRYEQLDAVLAIDAPVKAPIRKGASLGTVSVKLDNTVLIEEHLIGLDEINEGGLWDRVSDYVSLRFKILNAS
jgi:D-alanyl-D-alanine carboxypeptidase (penicillin-binding protein 5/6)